MIIDECHYQLKKTIEEFSYDQNLESLQSQLKTIIDQQISQIENINYSNTAHDITYILTSFADNLFLIYGPTVYHNQWRTSPMEKLYFNTVTSGYLFAQKLKKVMENSIQLPFFMIYGYWLFFESLGSSHPLYNKNLKDFFRRTPTVDKIVHEDKSIVYHNNQTIKTNSLNILIFIIFMVTVIIGNKYLYLFWINNLLI
jgi:hypothetical protein